MAERVAVLLAIELKQDVNWVDQQVAEFQQVASGYLVSDSV